MSIYQEETNVHLPPTGTEKLSEAEVLAEIDILKKELKDDVIILGHHYQQNDIIRFADIVGDSLQLAKSAAKLQKEFIIFCGVHFMAETADMLTTENQKVILPDLRAGCSMADMAVKADIERAWKFFQESLQKNNTSNSNNANNFKEEIIIPITYINCAATLKSFVGENGGAICTSSNAKEIISWAFTKGTKLLFFPDQHLGRNTCFSMGIPLEKMVVYDPRKKNGGLTSEEINKAQVILWYGFCSVHQGFKIEHVHYWKKQDPEVQIIVHPECSFDVVQAADLSGSTSYIINVIEKAKPGSKFAIGTEINLVNRLKEKFPEQMIFSLSPYQCLCTTMYRIRPQWLLNSLREIMQFKKHNSSLMVSNIITVDDATKKWSLIALNRMLELK